MSIKKLKTICSFVLFFLFAGIITACGGGSKGSVSFKQASLTMGINQELDLSEILELTNCEIGDVSFVSSDTSVVYITPSNKLVTRSEGVSLITAEGYTDAVLEITVVGTTLTFDAPKNLAYDENKSAITWDAVYAGNTVATNYEVKISKDGADPIVEVVNKPSYQILGNGSFTVSVTTLEFSGIKKSQPTAEYTFAKLGAPTNLTYNDQTKKLSWQAGETSEAFRVFVNGVSGELLTNKETTLDLSVPQKYEISVMTCASETQSNVFGAMSVESLVLTRLSAPNLSVSNGAIIWEDLNAQKFNLSVVGTTTTNLTIDKNLAGKYSYAFSGMETGTYEIGVVAVGDSEDLVYNSEERFLNSTMSSVQGIEKLQAKQITFDKLNKKIKVVDFESGLNLQLNVKFNGTTKTYNLSENGECYFEFVDAGEYEFSLISLSQSELQVNSDTSKPLYVNKLQNVSLANHKVEDGKYYVEGYSVENATSYTVKVCMGQDESAGTILTDYTRDINTLFKNAGDYSVIVVAEGTDDVLNKVYFLESSTKTKLSVTRLADVSLSNDKDNKKIIWNSVSSIGNLRYAYILNSEDEQTLETNSFDYSGLGVGSHTIKVWATVSEQVGSQSIVLGSLAKDEITFDVKKTLDAPAISWSEGMVDGVKNYYLNITNQTDVTHYEIYANGAYLHTIEKSNAEKTTYNVTESVNDAGEYVFTVRAINTTLRDYLLDSASSEELTAIRLSDFEIGNNIDSQKITWTGISGVNGIAYAYELKGPESGTGNFPSKATDVVDSREFGYSSLGAGKYIISVWATAKANSGTTMILDSAKVEITFGVEKTLQSPNLAWKNENNKIEIRIANQDNATSYDVYLEQTPIGTTAKASGEYTFVEVTDKLAESGEYKFYVVANNTQNQYYKPSEKSQLTAVRLSELNLNNDASKITWDAITKYSNVLYEYEVKGPETNGEFAVCSTGTQGSNSFNYTNLQDAGKYKFIVYATAVSESSSILMLDSNKTEIEFDVIKTIQSPSLAWEKSDNNGVVKYSLIITNTLGAKSYVINCNNGTYGNVINATSTKTTVFDATDIIANAETEFVFSVTPTGEVGGYYADGSASVLTVKKIASPSTVNLGVTSVGGVVSEQITSSISQPYYNGNEILVKSENDDEYVKTNILNSEANQFTVKVKYFAKTSAVSGVYYLDSEYSEFTFKRITTSLNVDSSIISWSSEDTLSTNQTFTPSLSLNINGAVTQIPDILVKGGSYDLLNVLPYLANIDSATLTLVYVANSTVCSDSAKTYFLTSNKNSINIKKATKETIGLTVAEENEKVAISWTKNENATYKLNNEQVTKTSGQNVVYEAQSTYFTANTTKYFSLEETTTSGTNVYLFAVKRVKDVANIKVTTGEEIVANETLSSEISKLVCLLEGVEITNLTSVTSSKIVYAYYKAGEANDYNYYLNGNNSEFKFRRLEKNSNLTISNDSIGWFKEDESLNTYKYRVVFSDGAETMVEKYLTVINPANQIDLTTAEYSNIIYNQKLTYFRIQKVVTDDFVANANASGTYCLTAYDSTTNNVQLKVLNAPSEIYINADETFGQLAVQITWDITIPTGYVSGGYVIEVYKNGSLQKTFTDADTMDTSLFASAGEWTVRVKAKGQTDGDTISSDFSEFASITRLAQSSSIALSKDGTIKWAKVENANDYVLEYSYTKEDLTVVKEYITNNQTLADNNDELEYSNFEVDGLYIVYDGLTTKLDEKFYGAIDVKVYALGTGTSEGEPATLSSTKASSGLNRLQAVNAQFTANGINILNFGDYTQNETIYINASINGNKLIARTISVPAVKESTYLWTYEPFTYENGTKVEFTEITDIDIEIYVTSKTANTIDSNVVSETVSKLAPLTNLRFVREDGTINFKADSPNVRDGYVGTTIATIAGNNFEASGNIVASINEKVLSTISSKWTLNTYVKAPEDSLYIDSDVVSMSGTKLSAVNAIMTSDDHKNVIWDSVTGASSYIMSVYNSENESDVTYKTKTELQENLDSYLAGEYVFAVKAIGNITETEITSDIILDAVYSEKQSIVKLPQITGITVQDGYIVLNEVEGADDLVAVLYNSADSLTGIEYSLTKITLPTGEDGNYYSNNDLISKLTDGKAYYLKFYAKATKEYYISSNFAEIADTLGNKANYMVVQLFEESLKGAEEVIALSHPNIDAENINYAITNATFSVNSVINNGIFVSINGANSKQVANYLRLDADESWAAGEYKIKYAQVGSTGVPENRLVYLTKFGAERTVTKIGTTKIQIAQKDILGGTVFENYLTFSKVNNASLYYVYLNNNLYGIYNNSVSELDLSKLPAGEYTNISVRAVSKEIDFLAGNLAVLLNDEEEPKPQAIKILDTKTMFVKDGAFGISATTSELMELADVYQNLNSIDTSLPELIINHYASIRFTNKLTGAVVDEQLTRYIKLFIGSYFGYNGYGFPYLDYSFLDFFKTLPGGEYDVQMKIMGTYKKDGVYAFTSSYSSPITVYVSNAPVIGVENNDDVYNLKFKNVIVDTKYFTSSSSLVYNLVGIYKDETGANARRILPTHFDASGDPVYGISPKAINSADETIVINLTELIEKGYLTSDFTHIYVYVSGTNNSVIQGKCSNRVEIKVLEKISAFVEHGIIKWASQTDATKYVITYGESVLEIPYNGELSTYEWKCAELEAKQEYAVSIMAYGTQSNYGVISGRVVISGPVTNIGKVTKLEMISNEINGIEIVDGLYKWNEIANATGYDVFILANEVLDGKYGDYNTVVNYNKYNDGTILYETTANNEINYYYFRAVGTEDGVLSDASSIFVNSEISKYNRAVRNTQVKDACFKNGILTWAVDNTSVAFRLTFKKAGSEDVVINLTNADPKLQNKDGKYLLDTNSFEELKGYGEYTVLIQNYFINKTETATSSGTYYVISSATELNFYKLETVNAVTIKNGEIAWNYTGNTSSEHSFMLEFTYYDTVKLMNVTKVKYVASGMGNKFNDIIFEDDISDYPITLVIYVIPCALTDGGEIIDNTKPFAISKPLTYTYMVEGVESTEVRQFDKVDENTIDISITSNGQLLIDWAGADDSGSSLNCYYELEYYTDKDTALRYLSVEQSQILCGEGSELSFNIDGEYSLFVRIRVIPKIDNFVSSGWTTAQEIKKPSKIQGLTYNAETYEYSWDKYGASEGYESSFIYKVKDEIGYYNEDGDFVVEKAYVFNAEIGHESFTPFILGEHRVSVAVIMTNSELMSDYCDTVNSTIDLFSDGDGTSINPYIIANETDFSNIKYRLMKDSVNNYYYKGIVENGEMVGVEEERSGITNDADRYYHFVQTNHLRITKDYALMNYDGEFDKEIEFNGKYYGGVITESEDIKTGGYYSITLVWNEDISSNSSVYEISLFERIGAYGYFGNVNLQLELYKTNENGVTTPIEINKAVAISGVALENYGTISNVVVGKLDSNKNITFEDLIYNLELSYIAKSNHNLIEKVENYYNTTMKTANSNATISFGAIAINNMAEAKIIAVKNCGNIVVDGHSLNIGGIVQYMDNSSALDQAVNTGLINAYIKSANTSYIGGLVASYYRAKLSYSYVTGDITVFSPSTVTPSVYVGGLVGYAEGDNISYSYVNITKNAQLESDYVNYAYNSISQLIGSLQSPTNNSNNVYYKRADDFGAMKISGTMSDEFMEYEGSVPTTTNAYGLFESSETKFAQNTTDINGNPILTWEEDFAENIWIALPAEVE